MGQSQSNKTKGDLGDEHKKAERESSAKLEMFKWFDTNVQNLLCHPDLPEPLPILSEAETKNFEKSLYLVNAFGTKRLATLQCQDDNFVKFRSLQSFQRFSFLPVPRDTSWCEQPESPSSFLCDDVILEIFLFLVPEKGSYTSISYYYAYKMMEIFNHFSLVSRRWYHLVHSDFIGQALGMVKDFSFTATFEKIDFRQATEFLRRDCEEISTLIEKDRWYGSHMRRCDFFEKSGFPLLPLFNAVDTLFINQYFSWKMKMATSQTAPSVTAGKVSSAADSYIQVSSSKQHSDVNDLRASFERLFLWRIIVYFGQPTRYSLEDIKFYLTRYLKSFPKNDRARDLLQDLEKTMKPMSEEPDELEKLVYELRNQNSRQWGQPGGISLERSSWGNSKKDQQVNPYADLKDFVLADPNPIVKFGQLKRLANHLLDRTCSRTVSFHRDFRFSHHIWRTWRFALNISQHITGKDFKVYTYDAKALKGVKREVLAFCKAATKEGGLKKLLMKEFEANPTSVMLEQIFQQFSEEEANALALVKLALSKLPENSAEWNRKRILEVLFKRSFCQRDDELKAMLCDELFEKKMKFAVWYLMFEKKEEKTGYSSFYDEKLEKRIDEFMMNYFDTEAMADPYSVCQYVATYFLVKRTEDEIIPALKLLREKILNPDNGYEARVVMRLLETLSPSNTWGHSFPSNASGSEVLKDRQKRMKGEIKKIIESFLHVKLTHFSSGSCGEESYSNLRVCDHAIVELIKSFPDEYGKYKDKFGVYKSVNRKRKKFIDCILAGEEYVEEELRVINLSEIEDEIERLKKCGDDEEEKVMGELVKIFIERGGQSICRTIKKHSKKFPKFLNSLLSQIVQQLSIVVYACESNKKQDLLFDLVLGTKLNLVEIVTFAFTHFVGKFDMKLTLDRDVNEFGFVVTFEIGDECAGPNANNFNFSYNLSGCAGCHNSSGSTSGTTLSKFLEDARIEDIEEEIFKTDPTRRIIFNWEMRTRQ